MKSSQKPVMGGVILSAILSLSLLFASCSNNSDSNDSNSNPNYSNPSPTLPKNVGENPIKKTIILKDSVNSDNDYYLLQLNTNGTALMTICYRGEKEPISQLKYTYNADKKEIYMKVEKLSIEDEGELLTYGELLSKINKECPEEEREEWLEDLYAFFGAQVTYGYEIKNGKITLTERFTGVQNMVNSSCYGESLTGDENVDSLHVSIDCSWASISIHEQDGDDAFRCGGIPNIAQKTISFRTEDGKLVCIETYTEDIVTETVTINFKDNKYPCKFKGMEFTQVE